MDLPEIKGNHRKFRTLVSSYIGNHVHQNNFCFLLCAFWVLLVFTPKIEQSGLWIVYSCDLYTCSFIFSLFFGIFCRVHFECPFFFLLLWVDFHVVLQIDFRYGMPLCVIIFAETFEIFMNIEYMYVYGFAI